MKRERDPFGIPFFVCTVLASEVMQKWIWFHWSARKNSNIMLFGFKVERKRAEDRRVAMRVHGVTQSRKVAKPRCKSGAKRDKIFNG